MKTEPIAIDRLWDFADGEAESVSESDLNVAEEIAKSAGCDPPAVEQFIKSIKAGAGRDSLAEFLRGRIYFGPHLRNATPRLVGNLKSQIESLHGRIADRQAELKAAEIGVWLAGETDRRRAARAAKAAEAKAAEAAKK